MYPDPNVSFHHYFAGLATLANDVDAGRQLHVGYALTGGRCGAVQTVDDPAVGGGGGVGDAVDACGVEGQCGWGCRWVLPTRSTARA